MPFGTIHTYPGGTEEQYERLIARVHPSAGTLPEGQTYLAGGPTPDGWVVISLWDGEESWISFRDALLAPGVEHLGDDGFPGPPEEVTFAVHTSTNGLTPVPRETVAMESEPQL